jgi:hypothetical protein
MSLDAQFSSRRLAFVVPGMAIMPGRNPGKSNLSQSAHLLDRKVLDLFHDGFVLEEVFTLELGSYMITRY